MASTLSDSINEIDLVKRECLKLLQNLRSFHPLAAGASYPDTYRLLVVPLLYAAWERCFTFCNAIAWRRLREECPAASTLTSPERAAWLMRAGFYRSFTKKLVNASDVGDDDSKPKRSQFPTLSEFLGSLDGWHSSPLDQNIDAISIVMTFANVNPDVVTLNAEALGITSFPAFAAIKFGRLHSLVGLRNNIGHGGTIAPPPNNEFADLWDFTEKLIEDYSEAFKAWLQVRFAPPPPPPSKMWRIGKKIKELFGEILSIL
jgi:RiboL-PSP-HEPN